MSWYKKVSLYVWKSGRSVMGPNKLLSPVQVCSYYDNAKLSMAPYLPSNLFSRRSKKTQNIPLMLFLDFYKITAQLR